MNFRASLIRLPWRAWSISLTVLLSWCNAGMVEVSKRRMAVLEDARVRRVPVVRDYGMFECRETPQYYPPTGSLVPMVIAL